MFVRTIMVSVFLLLSIFLVAMEGFMRGMVYIIVISLFFGFLKWVDFISRWIKYSNRITLEISGEILDTYVVTKPRYGSIGGRASTMNVNVEVFNCLDILLSNGDVYKVLECFNENPYQHYEGNHKGGDSIKLMARVYDDQYYAKEDFFRAYYNV